MAESYAPLPRHLPTRTIDATRRPPNPLPVSETELWIAGIGALVMLALGLGLGFWLELPFGATG